MVMGEAGNPEAIWTVQVVAPTEIHMMVTVRYDSMSVWQQVTKKSCTNNHPNHSSDYCNIQSQDAAVFPLPRGNRISSSLFLNIFSLPLLHLWPAVQVAYFHAIGNYITIGISTEKQNYIQKLCRRISPYNRCSQQNNQCFVAISSRNNNIYCAPESLQS